MPVGKLAGTQVAHERPILFVGETVEVLLDNLFSPRQPVPSAHGEIMSESETGLWSSCSNKVMALAHATFGDGKLDSPVAESIADPTN
jgi:hypothetical protein